jgi:hypothetical protein
LINKLELAAKAVRRASHINQPTSNAMVEPAARVGVRPAGFIKTAAHSQSEMISMTTSAQATNAIKL